MTSSLFFHLSQLVWNICRSFVSWLFANFVSRLFANFLNRNSWIHSWRQISCNFQTPLLNWLDPTVESNWEKFSDEYFIIKLNDDIAAVVISRKYSLLRLLAAQLTIETNLLTVSEIKIIHSQTPRSLSAILCNLSLLVLLCLEMERISLNSANIKKSMKGLCRVI